MKVRSDTHTQKKKKRDREIECSFTWLYKTEASVCI